jgi:hypothetical protein
MTPLAPKRGGLRQNVLPRCDSSVGNADTRCCTTRRGNAHRTDKAEEREVLYPWHPWVGHVVVAHEVIEKADGVVLRCSRMAKQQGAGWNCRPGCLIARHVYRCRSHAVRARI